MKANANMSDEYNEDIAAFQYLKGAYKKAGERLLQGCVGIAQEAMALN